MKNMSMYVPAVRPSGRFYAPSGALTPSQVLDFQGALVWLGHLPASQVTGREPVASAAVLRTFQQNYNAENRCRRREPGAPCQAGRVYGAPLSPARISEDGQWGPQTMAALQHFVTAARTAAVARLGAGATGNGVGGAAGGTIPGVYIEPLGPTQGGSTGKAPVTGLSTDGKGSTTPAVRPSTTSTSPAPVGPAPQPAASTFPVGPAIAVGVGVVAILGALYVRSQRKSKGR